MAVQIKNLPEQYEVIRKLGEGSYGIVFLVFNKLSKT
jgi:hypothetical protein